MVLIEDKFDRVGTLTITSSILLFESLNEDYQVAISITYHIKLINFIAIPDIVGCSVIQLETSPLSNLGSRDTKVLQVSCIREGIENICSYTFHLSK